MNVCVPLSAPERAIVFQGERQIKEDSCCTVCENRTLLHFTKAALRDYSQGWQFVSELLCSPYGTLLQSFAAKMTLMAPKSKTFKSIVNTAQKILPSTISKEGPFLSLHFPFGVFSHLQGWRSREHWRLAAAGRGCWTTGFQGWAWWPRCGGTAWCPRCCRPETGPCRHRCRAEEGWESVGDWECRRKMRSGGLPWLKHQNVHQCRGNQQILSFKCNTDNTAVLSLDRSVRGYLTTMNIDGKRCTESNTTQDNETNER